LTNEETILGLDVLMAATGAPTLSVLTPYTLSRSLWGLSQISSPSREQVKSIKNTFAFMLCLSNAHK